MSITEKDGSNQATVIFPHQLFETHPGLFHSKRVYLVEDPLFFFDRQRKIKFHKKKLILHRASMLYFKEKLESQGLDVRYIPYRKKTTTDDLFQRFTKDRIQKIWVADVVHEELDRRLSEAAQNANIQLVFLPTPDFLTDKDWLKDFFAESEHYSQTKFYIAQRKRLDILVEKDKPVGGKWSFDPLNRRKVPRGTPVPEIPSVPENVHVKEAKDYVKKNFPSHPGNVEDFPYPVTHEDARSWLDDFLNKKLEVFGDYEDAMVHDEAFLFHSVLTPSLNVGLICPQDIVDRTLAFAEEHPVPINSLEGFIRQVIGWREFMRAIYILEGERERTSNFWGNSRIMPDSLYTATTGIGPVDTVIERIMEWAYAHHIERLMVLGNFMLLCDIAPLEVYRWFMEMFIDAYDWVMVPNVFGMSQFADGGLITTKPYISSSRYILKMSDFPKGDWCAVWDALYWRFIDKHRDLFARNPRMRVMTFQLEKMDKKALERHHHVASRFLENL